MSSKSDHYYMARAIKLAYKGLYSTDPNPRVGCVIVKDQQIVGEGWHQCAGGPHAEINALKVAGINAKGATAYVSLEPCSHHGRTAPCSEALISKKVGRVVAAMQDPNPLVAGNGFRQLEAAGIPVRSGILQTQAQQLNPGYILRMSRQRPLVRSKMAMSLDGRTALANGQSKWITGEKARHDVQCLRARSSAILTGIGTVLADDPSLNVRLPDAEQKSSIAQPVRVVLDTRLAMPLSAKMLSLPGRTLVFSASEEQSKIQQLQQRGAEIIHTATDQGQVDLNAVLEKLAALGINEVLVEAGSKLNGALLQAGLIDELIIYMAATLLGDDAKGLISLEGISAMAQRITLNITDIRAVGEDWRISATVAKNFI